MVNIRLVITLFQLLTLVLCARSSEPTVDSVLQGYVHALGGQTALDKITTREIDAKVHRRGRVTYYWDKPDKVLELSHGEKFGFDGNSTWALSRKKKLTKLSKAEQRELETNANPVRYAHLKELYGDLAVQPSERIDDRLMDVLVSGNNIGSTKFYFDAATHLLVRIDDFGVSSAYYKHVIEFSNYKNVDGIQFPFRIVYTTNEPGTKAEDIRVLTVNQNVELKPEMFTRPKLGTVTMGGKR